MGYVSSFFAASGGGFFLLPLFFHPAAARVSSFFSASGGGFFLLEAIWAAVDVNGDGVLGPSGDNKVKGRCSACGCGVCGLV